MFCFTRLLFCLFLCVLSFRQSMAQSLFFERITGQTLTPNTPVHGIVKDSLGYIWFGSWNGLYRYNGLEFEVFRTNPEDSLTIPGNRIRNIITDEKSQLWVLTFNNQYVRYNYAQNSFQVVPDSLVNPEVIYLLKSNANKLNRDKIINNIQYYLSSHHLTANNLNTGHTFRYYTDVLKYGSLTDDYITWFYIDDQNIIWVGSRSGSIFKASTNRKPFELHHNYIIRDQRLIPTAVRAILKTKNELWLGTNHNGISVYRNGNLYEKHPYYKSGFQQTHIRTLFEDESGNVWIGGISGLECYIPEVQKCVSYISKELQPDLGIWSVFTVAPSHGNQIWVGLYNAVAKIDLITHYIEIIDLTRLVGNHSIMKVLEDRDKGLWLAMEGNGIIRLKFNSLGNIIDTVLLSRNLNLTDVHTNQITGNLVYALYEDSQGDIWAGTSEGVDCIDPVNLSVRHFTHSEGLPVDYVSAITGDKNGNIWLSHKMGISKINKSNFKISNYYLEENNIDWVFLDGAYYNDSIENILYFGAREGYLSFNPNLIKRDSFAPEFLLTSLILSGKRVEPKEKINGAIILDKVLPQTSSVSLDYKNRSFDIEMAALYYQSTQGVRYYYMLEGYNDTWIESKINRASYTKVTPGQYVFIAKAVTPDGNWSRKAELKIHILPPWYTSYWAISIYILITLAVLYFVYREILSRERLKNLVLLERLKVEKQKEINSEKLDFFTNVSHELRTPLTLIADPFKQLQKKNIDEKNRSLYLSIIERNISHLTKLINQLLDFRKIEAGKLIPKYTLNDGVEIIRDSMRTFDLKANERNIKLNFKSEMSHLTGYFDEEKLKQIIINLVSNALKYTPDNGEVQVTVLTDGQNRNFSILIRDNGIGISTDALKRIFEPFNNEGAKPFYGFSSGMGLALTRKLVELLGGQISIDSHPHKGTTVQIVLPFEDMNMDYETTQSVRPAEETDGNRESPESEEIRNTKPVVLIVEDSRDVQSYLKAELNEKYTILAENNGLDGYKSAVNNVPDIIISDVMMPKMDGITLCKKIKTSEQSSHIPVILLTAKASDSNRIKGLKTGADVYIAKPFSVEVLKAQMDSVIENRLRLQAKLADKKYVSELGNGDSKIENTFLNKTISIINQNINVVEFNPEQLAKELKISRRQLYRKLIAITGSTVHEFITRVRMEKAAGLLLDSDLNISEIAYETGFSEPSNFSRTFSKHYGCSPTKYIKTKN